MFLFRCIIYFTEDSYKNTIPSNIFVRAKNSALAEQSASKAFINVLVEKGIPNLKFKIETKSSSEEEVELYKHNCKSGSKTHQTIN